MSRHRSLGPRLTQGPSRPEYAECSCRLQIKGCEMAEKYPYEAKAQIEALIETLSEMVKRQPDQTVQGVALPVLDAVLNSIQGVRPNNPVVVAARGVIRPEQVAAGEPVRAVDVLVVAKQLSAAIGPYPLVVA